MPGAAQRLRFSEANNPVNFLLINDKFKIKAYKQEAIDLIQVNPEVTNASMSSVADSTMRQIKPGCLVKIQPYMDEGCVVEWAAVEKSCYDAGARFVKVCSPIIAKKEIVDLSAGEQISVREYVEGMVKDKTTREGILEKFESISQL
jgi:hypothetical protein